MSGDPESLLASAHGLVLHTANDALDVLASGLQGCIFTPAELHPEFFDLHNRIAGEALQKFVNYRFRVAFVITQAQLGDRVNELIREHHHHPYIRFFQSIAAAEQWLASPESVHQ